MTKKETADLVTFTEEIVNEKLCFLCSEGFIKQIWKMVDRIPVQSIPGNMDGLCTFKLENCSRFEFPAGIYLLKVKNRKTRTRCEIC